VKFAAHSSLLFVADGKQLVREPALIGLGLRGNVASHSDEADNFPGEISDGCGKPLQYAQRAIRKRVRLREAEGGTGTDRRFKVLTESIDIFEFQDSPDFAQIGRELRRVKAMKLKELLGPADLAGIQVELPSTHSGGFLGMSQHYFGVAQTLCQNPRKGDIPPGQDEIWKLRGGGFGVVKVKFKPMGITSPLTSRGDRDLKRKGVGPSGKAARGAEEEARHWRAQQGSEMTADAAATEFEGQLAVGTPHADNLSGGIELEDEFMKLVDQASQVTLVLFGEGD
jgi:hypothetical protein